MSARSLPDHTNLEQLKKQAKDLLKAFRSGDPDAVRAFGDGHPRAVQPEASKLTDAQLVLARSYGYGSWPAFRKDVAARQLRCAIWDRDVPAVRAALEAEPETLRESGPHPRFGGSPAPIQIAAERGDLDTVTILLDQGAHPDDGTDSYGWSALQLAAHWGHDDVAHVLIDRGADVDIFSAALLGDTDQVTRLLDEDTARASTPGLNDAPPLHVAATVDVARILVERGAPLDTVDSYGRTPIGSVIGKGEQGQAIADFLFDAGSPADPCLLAALGKTDALAERIQSDPEAVSFVGSIALNAVSGTPLHAAAQHSHLDAVSLLLEHGADPNARAGAGQTPLHLCSDPAIARRLVEAGADAEAVDDEHKTPPLTWARVGIDIHGPSSEREQLVEYLESLTTT